MKRDTILWTVAAANVLAAVISGCSSDERVARVATQAADRQAEQNGQMAKVTDRVAEGSRQLVEADAAARKEIVTVHHELQSERTTLGEQWNKLEAERQAIAQDRRSESILVPALEAAGTAAVTILVIAFCLLLLFGLRKGDDTDALLGELLLDEIIADRPRLLSGRVVSTLPGSDVTSQEPDLSRSDRADPDSANRSQ